MQGQNVVQQPEKNGVQIKKTEAMGRSSWSSYKVEARRSSSTSHSSNHATRPLQPRDPAHSCSRPVWSSVRSAFFRTEEKNIKINKEARAWCGKNAPEAGS